MHFQPYGSLFLLASLKGRKQWERWMALCFFYLCVCPIACVGDTYWVWLAEIVVARSIMYFWRRLRTLSRSLYVEFIHIKVDDNFLGHPISQWLSISRCVCRENPIKADRRQPFSLVALAPFISFHYCVNESERYIRFGIADSHRERGLVYIRATRFSLIYGT